MNVSILVLNGCSGCPGVNFITLVLIAQVIFQFETSYLVWLSGTNTNVKYANNVLK